MMQHVRSSRCAASSARRIALVLGLLASSFAAPLHAQLPPASASNIEPSEEARQLFSIGVAHLQDPDGARYEEAYKAFLKAYTISPSWKILGNLGLSAFKLERFTDAIQAYERYLAAGGNEIDPAERQQIERDIQLMKGSSGVVDLRSDSGAATVVRDTRHRTVGGPVTNEYTIVAGGALTLYMVSGRHELVARSEGRELSAEINVAANERVAHTFTWPAESSPAAPVVPATPGTTPPSTPPPATSEPKSSGSLGTVGLVVGGVGAAMLVGGTVTGVIGLGKKSDLEGRCPGNTCEYENDAERDAFESDQSSLRTLGTLTTVFLIGGGVLAATGVTLMALPSGPSERPTALQIDLDAPTGLASGRVLVRGRF